jgi:hypothetical protein
MYSFDKFISKINKSYGEDILWTPLQYASAMGKQKMVDFLLDNGADPSIKDVTGRTAQKISNYISKRDNLVPVKMKVQIKPGKFKSKNSNSIVIEEESTKSILQDPNVLIGDGKMEEFQEFQNIFNDQYGNSKMKGKRNQGKKSFNSTLALDKSDWRIESQQFQKIEINEELYSQMKSKFEGINLENQQLKLENQSLRAEIEKLKTLIHPDVPCE